MSRSQSLGETSLDPWHHSSAIRDPINDHKNNGRGGGGSGDASHATSLANSREHLEEHAAVGETGTFRSRAMARRWVNNSRRRLLEKNASSRSLMSNAGDSKTGSSSVMVEETPLISVAIPEDRSASNLELMGSQESSTGEKTKRISIWSSFLDVWFGKFVSIFLLATPLALWVTARGWSGAWIFWTNFFVLLPLASILGDFTEEAALHTNDIIGGLLNATFGNCVEVIVGLQALLRDEIRVVQASMIGSIFSNLLLVVGSCFLFGGIFHREQRFNVTSANAMMGLLALSSLALVLPTPYAKYYEIQDEDVLMISRAAAIGLLVMYVQLLFFQLHTHRHVFDGTEGADGDAGEEEDEDDQVPSIPMWMALFGLGSVTLLIAWFSDALVGSIDHFCEETGVSKTFVGLIILPIVGNAVEHITAVNVGECSMQNEVLYGRTEVFAHSLCPPPSPLQR